ncbi:8419_t:CDS:2 [Funneliformis geosporum]|nr:8419_t:CDS:2 [Funneliformis geosporum]
MSNTNLQETFNNFDYILNNYNEDLENIIFAGSFTSETREFVEKDVNKNISLLKDINYNTDFDTKTDINTSTSIFDSESTTLGSTYKDEYY